jgi:hypothetical protein
MSKESQRIAANIGCLDTKNLRVALISTVGAHCDVWQSAGHRVDHNQLIDVVIKCHTLSCAPTEVNLYYRDYLKLKACLRDIIPQALFVKTHINGEDNMLVIAHAYTPWFNLANPVNRDEAFPLIARLPKARIQLARFVRCARQWWEEEQKVIDLYGLDNLVLDKNREVRYLDSFEVFFYEDLLHLIDDPGEELEQKIAISLKRLEYLEELLESLEQQDLAEETKREADLPH